MGECALEIGSVLRSAQRSGDDWVTVSITAGQRRISETEADLINAAITAANVSSLHLYPNEPTAMDEGVVINRGLLATLTHGIEHHQVAQWFADFAAAIEATEALPDLRVKRSRRRPTPDVVELGRHYGPSPTAVMAYTPHGEHPDDQYLPADTWALLKEVLPGWVEPGTNAALLDMGRPGAELGSPHPPWPIFFRRRPDADTIRTMWSYDTAGAVSRTVQLGLRACGFLQVAGDRPKVQDYSELLQLLRRIGPHLDYAYIRRGQPMLPTISDHYMWGEQPTDAERLVDGQFTYHLRDHVAEAAVAQIVTDTALSKIASLDGFTVEALGRGRNLLHHRDPARWFDSATATATIEAARTQFGPAAFLTTEIWATGYTNPPW